MDGLDVAVTVALVSAMVTVAFEETNKRANSRLTVRLLYVTYRAVPFEYNPERYISPVRRFRFLFGSVFSEAC